jgi:nucleoside-diphosphate-sugar epimerase
MNILIIGGTGNISTAITRLLLQRGDTLTLFKKHATPPGGLPASSILTGDRSDRARFRETLAAAGPWDCVIDMICFEPEDAACDVEVFRGRTKQFIFCSTVDVYTKTPASYPVTEDNGVISASPSFPYAFKKVECERIFQEAHRRGDFALTILRPAATYNDAWSPGVHTFGGQTYHLDRLRKGKPILLHGDGSSIWVASHRDDVAVPFANAAGNSSAYGQDYNVTGDELMTHNHIWRVIARALGAPPVQFVYVPTQILARIAPRQAEWCVENFQYDNIFDNSKVKRALGYRYNVPFEEGVRRCIERLTRDGSIEDCGNHPFYDRIVEAWLRHAESLCDEFREVPL